VPQSCVLGFFVLLLFISDIEQLFGSNVTVKLFADDLKMYIVRPHRSTIRRCGLWLQLSGMVCRSVTVVSPAKATEPIGTPFRLWIPVGPRNHVLDWGLHLPLEGAILGKEVAHCKV